MRRSTRSLTRPGRRWRTPWFAAVTRPLPVRTPLPVELPEAIATQLRAAQQAAAEQGGQEGEPPQPVARRAAPGSAMQQLRTTMGGG